MIDNYDSFTYNLVQMVDENFNGYFEVKRNDAIDMEYVNQFDGLILSPGPGIPDEAGLLKPIIQRYASTKKMFGVCLGLQAIGEVFGAKLKNLDKVFHGVKTTMKITEESDIIFNNIPAEFEAGRYHSLCADPATLPVCLDVLARTDDGVVMAVQHKEIPAAAVQFHPESILTLGGDWGLKLIENVVRVMCVE